MNKKFIIGAVTALTILSTATFASAQTTYTALQVAAHGTSSDCWMIVSGKVYNLTTFLTPHPGGSSIMIPFCGKDGTSAFNTRGGTGSHSSSARAMLPTYYLGDLVTSTTTTPVATTTVATTTTPVATTSPVIQRGEWKLEVGPSGNVLLRGNVTSIASGTIMVKTWGGVWTVRIAQGAELLPWKIGKKVNIDHFQVGDYIGVQGRILEGESMAVLGHVVRNRTEKKEVKIEKKSWDDAWKNLLPKKSNSSSTKVERSDDDHNDDRGRGRGRDD